MLKCPYCGGEIKQKPHFMQILGIIIVILFAMQVYMLNEIRKETQGIYHGVSDIKEEIRYVDKTLKWNSK